ncbi:MAG: trehalose-6-phosphate synthase, partial [Alphaproteobacteria bacterium]|nr:trehalose-6-phosphate synthase [Alphaproteobacteria bacterium]
MSRLIVVSNRVAPAQRGRTSAGGLAVALLAALKESGGIWLGWSGEVTAAPAQAPKMVHAGRITYATLDLSQKEYTDYYNGFANSSLWPLFHYRLDLAVFSRQYFDTYQRVNARFAAALVPLLKPGDIIWIHDYHLMMMADALRRAGVKQPIGFFLHTPFPAHQILTALPRDQTLIRALLAYDLIGFQTEGDLVEFRDYILHEGDGELLDDNRVKAFGRTARAQAFPISIDTDHVATLAQQSQRSSRTTRLKESLGGRDLIVGVDRLDYSKGLVERFHAFEHLLQRYNDLRNRVVLMQIAPPSRADVAEYMEIRRTLETAAGHINGRFAE